MVITLASIGGALSVASFIGAYWTYRGLPIPSTRSRLNKLFRDGDICIKKKGYKGKEIKLYPIIRNVSASQDYIQAVFTIPNGMDPNKIHDSLWLFKQGFGEYIDLSGDTTVFTLIIYGKDMSQFDYKPKDILPVVKSMSLPIMAGKSRKGWEVYDMAKHPHLLISGVTGSGKSVALRSILTTLIESCGDKLELYCADLKRSEFHLFRGIAKQVVVTSDELRTVLMQIKKEMANRGKLLDKAEEAHIDDLPNQLPYIVLAIDEVSLLRNKRDDDIMDMIEDISSVGRALGVFLILSMQRPDSNILDGALKNNLTVRMAFRQSDEINSRIALGSGEAANIKLSQRGRMFMKGEELKLIQMPYLELKEARKLLLPHKELSKHKGNKHDFVDADFTVMDDDDDFMEEVL